MSISQDEKMPNKPGMNPWPHRDESVVLEATSTPNTAGYEGREEGHSNLTAYQGSIP